MKILSIDTASNLCTVAILEDFSCLKEIIIDDARNHSEKIMPIIEEIFSQTNLKITDMDLIVCDKGPGSFTGIRIGVGTVLAFQDSLNIPCIGITSLESLAYNVENNGIICSLIDAKNENIYFGLFEKNDSIKQIEEFSFKNINDAISTLKNYENITFVGDGSIIYKNFLENNLNNCKFCSKNNLSSVSLGIAGLYTYKNNLPNNLMPLYLRKSQAERALEEKSN